MIKRFIIVSLILFFISSSALLFLFIYLQSQPLPKTTIEQTTFIYSMDGQVIDDLYSGENRVYVPLSKIPKSLIEATIAIEDRKFYRHLGIDFVRIGGALIQDVKHRSKVQGASTITQQLARNLYLYLDKTWERKINEALLAIQLELQYSKDEILEMYLNQIYYGHSANGVQLAAKTYFDKDVSELNLAESAMIAGIPKGPGYYSPFINLKKAKERQKQVLQAMVSEGYITQQEANEAYQEKLVFKNPNKKNYPTIAPYFRDFIVSTLKTKYGFTEEQIFQGGLKVYTTLDSEIQKYAEEIITNYLDENNSLQVALISIEPSTGFIKAMVGGRDYSKSQYNRVFASRQPGSSFKPILYLAALENGFTPVTRLKSEPTIFTFGNNQTYQPSNFGDNYPNREIDLRYALAHSDNIYAVKTHMKIGMDKLVDMSNKLGIDKELKPYPSLALGSQEVTPFDMTKAYATIANQGKRVEPIAITKIVDSSGNVLYERKATSGVQVVSEASTFILTHLMEGVFEQGGTGFNVSDRLKRPIAGKTGTTDFDSWLIGYTPQLVTTLWTGYDDNQPLKDSDAYITKYIWADFMEKAHKSLPPQLFVVPDGITSLYICPETGKIATENCPNPRLEFFIEGTEPTEYSDYHQAEDSPESSKEPSEDPSFWNRIRYWWSN
ncbi:carboxypeptidase [Vulcanibacillus modesticaldus]|uniref:Carboxypeptidase n=2 Tax=Vulcanibacillus modesticaldus TaxID=337097 RepID=A0A1D2YW19_9BACI|nr:carboxypeptidase [Vulcanibacillus modesticaldus]